MYLMYYLDAEGNRVYTLDITAPIGSPTVCTLPARFSHDDKYSRQKGHIEEENWNPPHTATQAHLVVLDSCNRVVESPTFNSYDCSDLGKMKECIQKEFFPLTCGAPVVVTSA